MALDQRVDSLESEFRLIKAEIQTTLIDLRDFLDRQEFTPAAQRGQPERRAQDTQRRFHAPDPEPEPEPEPQPDVPGSTISQTHDPVPFTGQHQAPQHHVETNGSQRWPMVEATTRAAVPTPAWYDTSVALMPSDVGVARITELPLQPAMAQSRPPLASFRTPAPAANAPYATSGVDNPAGPLEDQPRPSVTPFAAHALRATPTAAHFGVTADLRLLVGALKWASMAATLLGTEGPRRVLDMYVSSWPLPTSVKRVFDVAIEQVGADVRADGSTDNSQCADHYTLLLLALHGLVLGQMAAVDGTNGA
jgi:hypothetical protein